MFSTPITIRVLNVELTEERRNYLCRQFMPLIRLVDQQLQAECTVIIRAIRRPLSGVTYCVMAQITTSTQAYYAVGFNRYLTRSIREARDDMRRSLSRAYTPDMAAIEHWRTQVNERYFVEMFV